MDIFIYLSMKNDRSMYSLSGHNCNLQNRVLAEHAFKYYIDWG